MRSDFVIRQMAMLFNLERSLAKIKINMMNFLTRFILHTKKLMPRTSALADTDPAILPLFVNNMIRCLLLINFSRCPPEERSVMEFLSQAHITRLIVFKDK